MAPGSVRIAQMDLLVRDLAAVAAFYRETIGLREMVVTGNLALFDCGGIRLALRRSAEPAANSPFYFRVENLDAAAAELRSRGVIFEREPHLVGRLPEHDVWMALFRDPEGNSCGLLCERRRGDGSRPGADS